MFDVAVVKTLGFEEKHDVFSISSKGGVLKIRKDASNYYERSERI